MIPIAFKTAGGANQQRRILERFLAKPYSPVMQIDISLDGNVTTIVITGEIDLHGSPALREKLQHCAGEKTQVLLVDFNGVEYIDSSGLATFIEYVRDASAHGGQIALFGLKPKVRTIFELVRLNELFQLSESAEAALAALEKK